MAAEQVTVTGRIVALKVDDGARSFAVTLGQLPNFFWFRSTGKPPRLGQKLTVHGERKSSTPVGKGLDSGTVTELEAQSFEVLNEPIARSVPPAALARVSNVMSRRLYRYQIEGAAWLATRVRAGVGAILADDMGLGKTMQTVAALAALRPFPAVVVCPASLKLQWAREFDWAREAPRVSVINGTKGALPAGADVYIVNYDILFAREAELTQLNPILYVLDEAQEVKNSVAYGKHRAAVITRLVRKRMTGAVLLTGTPLMNRPNELWRLLHLADPKRWPRLADYADRYLSAKKGEEVGRAIRTIAGKVERLDELHAEVDPMMLRRLKGDVLKDLPAKSRRTLLVRLDDASMKHYQAAYRDVVGWLRSIGKEQRAQNAKRAESLARLTMLRRIAAVGKLRLAIPQYLSSWFSSHTREPLVIFGYHKDVMLGLWRICQRLRLRLSGIGGGETAEKRQRQVDLFQSGGADVFLAPIESAGFGLNLQRASDALFVERVWSPSVMLQCEDRIHRIGTKKPVTITYLDAAGTVDERVALILEAKQRLIRAVVDDDHQHAESMTTVESVLDEMLKGD